MRLTAFTDYTLRVLMYVAARPDRLTTIREMATAYGISQNHLMKVVFELGRHGVLETVRGRGGGVRLARAPQDIRLGDIVRLTEAGSALVECFGAESGCIIAGPCRLKGVLSEALEAFLAVLDGYTLHDLVHANRGLVSRFLKFA
ncbi:MAG: Rrf2 family transcriptional regulator [Alphaproteobacteria bacterium]|nr:Rrf2 family transcriptional regulator [Alphaproteobacteria bacterium]